MVVVINVFKGLLLIRNQAHLCSVAEGSEGEVDGDGGTIFKQ